MCYLPSADVTCWSSVGLVMAVVVTWGNVERLSVYDNLGVWGVLVVSSNWPGMVIQMDATV